MKNRSFLLLLASALLTGAVPLHSQSPRGNLLQRLQTLKEQNAKLLEQQAGTLQKLEDLQKEAGQLRVFARRT